jgi:hypothetical protein
MHNAVAFTAGVPLGVLSQAIWAHEEVPQEGADRESDFFAFITSI